MIYERPPFRAAASMLNATHSISSTDSLGWFCGGTLVMGGSGAEKRTLCCRCHRSFALYGEAAKQSNAVLIYTQICGYWQEYK